MVGMPGDVPERGRRDRREELPSARVEADMRQRVAAREWESGEALPSVAELADHYGVSRTAVSRALKALESDGLIRIVPRWGTFRA